MLRTFVRIIPCLFLMCMCIWNPQVSAQNPIAPPKAISLHQTTPGYQELLTGPPLSVGMKSGLVVLAPGSSVGKHKTDGREEMVIVLEGRGEMVLTDDRRIEIGPAVAAYSPPG